MEPTGMDRRRVLSGVGVAAGAIVAGTVAMSSPAKADDGENRDNENNGNITGSWMVTRQSDNDPTDHAMAVLSFAAGNVMIIHDINPAGPPFTGTWARGSNHGFTATVWTGDSGGPQGPPSVLRVQLQGNVHKGTLSGTYHLTVLDAATNETQFEDTGTFSGQRINA